MSCSVCSLCMVVQCRLDRWFETASGDVTSYSHAVRPSRENIAGIAAVEQCLDVVSDALFRSRTSLTRKKIGTSATPRDFLFFGIDALDSHCNHSPPILLYCSSVLGPMHDEAAACALCSSGAITLTTFSRVWLVVQSSVANVASLDRQRQSHALMHRACRSLCREE